MKKSKINVFYTPEQVLHERIRSSSSKSPLKPMLLMKTLNGLGFAKNLNIISDFKPFEKDDFKIAHTEEYVEDFFKGGRLSTSNSLPWSPELADTVRYTNASLYNALRHSILNPDEMSLSPTSGFHHARPYAGSGFCTFAGQVIAAIKIYREFGLKGAVLDLDGHYGNSIEDCRDFAVEINEAIPKGFNVNPSGSNDSYVFYLKQYLVRIREQVLAGNIGYVMWCHGADSHDKDDLGGQVDTKHWVECSEIFYAWLKETDEILEAAGRKPLPVVMSLFGGYRRDHYASVISLHVKDLVTCMNTVCGHSIKYEACVSPKLYTEEKWEDGMPVSVIEMMNPFLKKKMTANEVAVFEFLKQNPGSFKGNELGLKIKNWANHSMGKWAKKLVKRGLAEGTSRTGYSFKNNV